MRTATCCLALLASYALAVNRPNLIMVLVDDLGVGYPSFMYNSPDPMATPAMDSLAKEGIILDSAYAYRFCSPSRASLLTGRAGWRHTAAIDNLIPWTKQEGVDLRYNMWPQRLVEEAGYPRVVHIGKHHQGLFSPEYTPVQRGFTSSYGFLSGGEDHVTQECFNPTKECSCRDLYNGTMPSKEPEGEYNTYRFTSYAVDHIKEHAAKSPDEPMAMYFALHVTHAPIEAPASAVDPFNSSIPFEPQRTFTGMLSMADQALANVTAALKAHGMWDNTLLLLAADNGSPVQVGGSNGPLRGGKGSAWEGGIRVMAVVGGGLVPQSQWGTRKAGMFQFSDVYATFTALAGLDPNDGRGPAPMDGYNQWPYWSGQQPSSPRDSFVIDHWGTSNPHFPEGSGAIIWGKYKLITAPQGFPSWYSGNASWYTPNATCHNAALQQVPNASDLGWARPHAPWGGLLHSPGDPAGNTDCFGGSACSPDDPCLFDLSVDETEHENIAQSQPAVLAQMLQHLRDLDNAYHPPAPSAENVTGYCGAIHATGGFLAPWSTS